jgi:hypothetical protein
MDYVCSLTGTSPSTTGAGFEGALTKGPFNAIQTTADLNNALVSMLLTGYAGPARAAFRATCSRKVGVLGCATPAVFVVRTIELRREREVRPPESKAILSVILAELCQPPGRPAVGRKLDARNTRGAEGVATHLGKLACFNDVSGGEIRDEGARHHLVNRNRLEPFVLAGDGRSPKSIDFETTSPACPKTRRKRRLP